MGEQQPELSHGPPGGGRSRRTKVFMVATFLFLVAAVIFYTQVTVFVVQPIGAVPEGRTVLILRKGDMRFIESADAMCERAGGVSLLCRGMTLAAVVSNNRILASLPYSAFLYRLSTGGREYGR